MSGLPNAWDDDYPKVADSKPLQQPSESTNSPRISRAERKAQHQQANKQLWESAENPTPFHYAELRSGEVPANAEFKPMLKVLSRKPAKSTDLENGTRSLNLDDDVDSEEEERQSQERKLKERQEQAAKDRVEKQRKYDEARARIMGTASPVVEGIASGRNSPTKRTVGRSRARADRRGGQMGSANRGSQETSSADQSPSRVSGQPGQLFDPNSAERPSSGHRQQLIPASVLANKPIRQPYGPSDSRRGFGFATRGKSTNVP